MDQASKMALHYYIKKYKRLMLSMQIGTSFIHQSIFIHSHSNNHRSTP